MRSIHIGTAEGIDRWHFACVCCGSQGELDIPVRERLQPFGCPEGCGATYVAYTGVTGRQELMCVVRPISAAEAVGLFDLPDDEELLDGEEDEDGYLYMSDDDYGEGDAHA